MEIKRTKLIFILMGLILISLPFILSCTKADERDENIIIIEDQSSIDELKQVDEEPIISVYWEVTQYSDLTGNQGMFYSIRNMADGSLVLIDGGNPQNADLVRQVIEDNGGYVDAWFLTHYHIDHIGAFNALWDEEKESIGSIYVTPIDYDIYESVAQYYDYPEVYAEFLEFTKDSSLVTALNRGDELEVAGLKVKVYNAFDEKVQELSTDWCNDCSLVLKFSGLEDSFLFLADLSRKGVPLADYILETYGVENVRADYVQAGHHGNWGLPISFYEQLAPKEIHFCAPEWLIVGEEYDAKDLKAWCIENAIAVHDFTDTPNTVILK